MPMGPGDANLKVARTFLYHPARWVLVRFRPLAKVESQCREDSLFEVIDDDPTVKEEERRDTVSHLQDSCQVSRRTCRRS